ncbi:MAG: hypothetical protein ACRDOE_02685 [Streptosporangiaceae bacterium]
MATEDDDAGFESDTPEERARARRGARFDAVHEDHEARRGSGTGGASDAEIAAMKARAKADPANQNPERTSQPRTEENRAPETRRARTSRVLRAPIPHTPTRAVVSRRSRQAGTGVRRLVTGKGPGRGKGTAAGFAVGFLLYAAGLNFFENGPGGAWAWVKAKFWNDTGGGAPVSKSAAPQVVAGSTASSPVGQDVLTPPAAPAANAAQGALANTGPAVFV